MNELREILVQVTEQKLVEFGGLPSPASGERITSEMAKRAAAASGRFHSGA